MGREQAINKLHLGNQVLLAMLCVISLPMTWLHVYTLSRSDRINNDSHTVDVPGYKASMDLYGFEIHLWLPIALCLMLSIILMLKCYRLASFSTWQTDAIVLLISLMILLPLWPCCLGSAYIGLGWVLGAFSATVSVFEYFTKWRAGISER